jgi:hypothetical protein
MIISNTKKIIGMNNMNTHTKLLITYYAKQITAIIGFALLYSLSMLTHSAEGISKIKDYYKKISEAIVYPVKVELSSASRNQVKVA